MNMKLKQLLVKECKKIGLNIWLNEKDIHQKKTVIIIFNF